MERVNPINPRPIKASAHWPDDPIDNQGGEFNGVVTCCQCPSWNLINWQLYSGSTWFLGQMKVPISQLGQVQVFPCVLDEEDLAVTLQQDRKLIVNEIKKIVMQCIQVPKLDLIFA